MAIPALLRGGWYLLFAGMICAIFHGLCEFIGRLTKGRGVFLVVVFFYYHRCDDPQEVDRFQDVDVKFRHLTSTSFDVT